MIELETFTFPETGDELRGVAVDGKPWFVGRDAALALGQTNPTRAIREHVPAAHRRETESVSLPDLGLQPQTVLISEAGLYRLIMRSNTPFAQQYQEWVTAEVLPAIRRTGRYETAPAVPQTYAQALRAAADAEEARETAEKKAAALEPRAHSWDTLAAARGDLSVADAAKILDRDPGIATGERRLFRSLAELQWVYRPGGKGDWRAYQRQVDTGRLSELPRTYEHPHTGETALATPQIRITVKGVAELHRLLGGTRQLQLPLEVTS